jgi:hypothetical protein
MHSLLRQSNSEYYELLGVSQQRTIECSTVKKLTNERTRNKYLRERKLEGGSADSHW